MECIEKHRHFQRGMPASSILNFRYFTCLLDKGHIRKLFCCLFYFLFPVLLFLLFPEDVEDPLRVLDEEVEELLPVPAVPPLLVLEDAFFFFLSSILCCLLFSACLLRIKLIMIARMMITTMTRTI